MTGLRDHAVRAAALLHKVHLVEWPYCARQLECCTKLSG